jgi:hypothetical protein
VAKLESQADWLKRNLRNHLPRGLLMPVMWWMTWRKLYTGSRSNPKGESRKNWW